MPKIFNTIIFFLLNLILQTTIFSSIDKYQEDLTIAKPENKKSMSYYYSNDTISQKVIIKYLSEKKIAFCLINVNKNNHNISSFSDSALRVRIIDEPDESRHDEFTGKMYSIDEDPDDNLYDEITGEMYAARAFTYYDKNGRHITISISYSMEQLVVHCNKEIEQEYYRRGCPLTSIGTLRYKPRE